MQGSAVGLVQPVARIQREELDLSSVGEICGFIHNKAPSADSSLQSHEWNASTREVAQQAVGAGRPGDRFVFTERSRLPVAQRPVVSPRNVSTVVLLALLIGLFIVAIGMCGVAAPHGLLTAVRFVLTPRGLYLVAAVRVVFGVILVLVAPSSRTPRVLRVWLVMASAATIVVGVILVATPEAPLLAGYNRSVAQAFWAQPQLPDAVRAYHRWTFGILGAAIAGWGVCNTCLLLYPFARRERWAFAALAAGIATWVPMDLLLSMRAGVSGEVVFVSAALLAFGVPLLFLWPYFRGGAA